ncbi:hypothetical protein [Conexibacter sp. S30A1]|uniref:hypothetical protein n=1 Tax=Conexibacter sp. S30A1 TaxID=2937800 RepID=UPI0020107416|nr:hypothetical protein [Conexibacter sp. S30A1]
MSAADQTDDNATVALHGNEVLVHDLAVDGAVVELVRQEIAAGRDPRQIVVRAIELGAAILLHGAAMGTVEAVEARVDRLVAALDDRTAKIESLSRMRTQVSSARGLEFEEAIGPVLERLAAPHEDELEATGATAGIADEKVGDYVITLNPRDTGGRSRRVVVELKKRKERPSLKAALGELDRAMLNRGAHVAVMVFSGKERAPMQGGMLRYYHGNRIMVVWEPDDEPGSGLALEVAIQLARTLAAKAESGDLPLDGALLSERLDKLISLIDRRGDIERAIRTAQNGLDTIEEVFGELHTEAMAVLLELQDRL